MRESCKQAQRDYHKRMYDIDDKRERAQPRTALSSEKQKCGEQAVDKRKQKQVHTVVPRQTQPAQSERLRKHKCKGNSAADDICFECALGLPVGKISA